MNKIYYSWTQVYQLTHSIVQQIQQDKWHPRMCVGVTRGGLIPAVIMSHMFNTPLETVNISLRDNPSHMDQNLQKIRNMLALEWSVLVVDDINDTGATVECIRKQLPEQQNLKIAVLTNNVASKSQVDYWGTQINKHTDPSWICFPWEQGGEQCPITC